MARFIADDDGKSRAVISEILKQEPGTMFYYRVGDEYPNASFYPQDNSNYGDGVVIFFTGSPRVGAYSRAASL